MKPRKHSHPHAHGSGHSPQHPMAEQALPGTKVTAGLLMTSSTKRVLGALGLIALLWLAVAWAVLFID